MLERFEINEPRELFVHKLGAALKMENTVAEMLRKLSEKTQSTELRELFQHHLDETHHQIGNLHEAFAAIGEEPTEKACPAIKGIQAEGDAMLAMTDESLLDAVILSGAAETEHHEIAVYEGLVTHAEAIGNETVVRLLQENLGQETHTLDEVRRATERVAGSISAGIA